MDSVTTAFSSVQTLEHTLCGFDPHYVTQKQFS